MTQATFDFEAHRVRRPSLTDKLAEYFEARPGQWISVAEMADLVGHSGVRQRRLECEKRGLVLERSWRGNALGFTFVSRQGEAA